MSDDSLVSLLLSLGDDELVIGHRHSEWTGFAPHIEEDVAFSSIAQDEIGHAAAIYAIAAAITDDDPDGIAFGRGPSGYRSAIICERSNRDWAFTLARHWLYDHADAIRLEALEGSSRADLAALATKMRREERYHLLHADHWIRRVSGGPVEGRMKVIDALTEAFPEALGLFEPFELEEDAIKEGWLPTPSQELQHRFLDRTTAALDDLGLPTEVRGRLDESAEFVASSSGDLIAPEGGNGERPSHDPSGLGGRKGRHSEDFEELWEVMTVQYRENPGAKW